MCKCSFPHGAEMAIAGIPVDPCVYQTVEIYRNVTIEVRRCIKCGGIDLAWHRQDDTESEVVDNG